MAKFTQDEIIVQFRKTHSNRYDYSLVEYLGDGVKVKIICSVHGIFEQAAGAHKRGSGCRKCAIDEIKPRQSKESLIKQFRMVHGMKYDYSQVVFKGVIYKIKIICPIHGLFEQRATMHKKGQGCAQCMYDGKRHSEEQVVKKFRKVHGSRYDYSLMKYVNTDTKIKIICDEHGVFEQTPDHHINGCGCPKCTGRGKTWEEVLVGFDKIHGNRYDYSESEFEMVTKKIKIKCSVHGNFFQTPQNHIVGKGCGKCAGSVLLNQSETIEAFIRTHGKRYDYSLVKYINGKTKVKIICEEHGIFKQLPQLHKTGSGCPRCAGVVPYTQAEMIQIFHQVHGERYDYSKVRYRGIFKKIKIICKDHGEFLQAAKSHKEGKGCPDCAITIGHTKENYLNYCDQFEGKTHLYLIKCSNETEEFFKVGISRLGAKERFNSSLKMPYVFQILEEIYGDASLMWDFEKSLHKLLVKYRYKPNIDFHGKTECFEKIPNSVYKLLEKFNNNQQLQLIS